MNAQEEVIDETFAKVQDNGHGDPFDKIVGHIEDIVIDEHFQQLQSKFLESNCQIFDDESEENKLEYTVLFEEYFETLETFITQQLCQKMPNFDIRTFLEDLELRRPELNGEIFEFLFTLTDFLAFKELMIDYKLKNVEDLERSNWLTITPIRNCSEDLNK